MSIFRRIETNRNLQYLIGVSTIICISLVCYFFEDIIGHHVVALILLLAVSILAMFFDTLPIVVIAVISALIWNFFFIPPKFTYYVGTPQDVLLFIMYFVVAIMNGVFTTKIRKTENKVRQREDREKTLNLYNTLLNSLSHELKTPISTIIGSIDMLQENNNRLSEKHKTELLQEAAIAGIRLNRQVNNLLNMSRVESGFINLQLDWCDINELVFKVLQDNSAESTNHQILFEPKEDLPYFKLDQGLLETILHNIIHNALQHTPAGTKIEIEVSSRGDICQIGVRDWGPGFPEAALNSVFEKFHRLENSRAGGTGLGLSIAKGFAQAHNGEIILTNLAEGGAEFLINIPAATSYLSDLKNE